jgi:hypothetical protein
MALFGKKRSTAGDDTIGGGSAKPQQASAAPVIALIVADVALRAGETALRQGIERGLLEGKAVPGRVIRGRTFKETVIGTILAEVARRSVPGAILVGGGLIAKVLSDRRKGKADAKAARADDQT